ncbi:zinc-dependent alcohol dehydrogenase [Clostridium sp. HV4-5-A1G]|uniref:zinc-dependent alcohol dehydrogenase n=1 Tax=Clostridium sp. HV4-5-A1G TaxID=2004595 RepID=UPI00123A7814|nr:alcohol dehydrogenase catalytic domain-containing protein [Clostridium sp. HV4-5-A1G]KAA8679072.1 alcohol dehydrogenase catalytic domain-containing protein [Clostridium sp. HV4-5-A1G]
MVKALVRKRLEAEQFFYEDVPKPEIDDNEVLIRVKAVGVCGTDYHMWTGGVITEVPLIVGHEFCGVVEEIGDKVTSVKLGYKVVSRLNMGVCGICRSCLTGNPHMCVHRQCPGFKIQGAYAEYIAVDSKQLIKLDNSVSYEEGALVEPMAIVATALLERTKIEPEDVVVIFGPGPIGLIAMQMAKVYGASKVIMVGTNVDEALRMPLAKKLGSDFVINAQKQNAEKEIMKLTCGEGADLVVEASGSEPAINSGLKVLRRQGKMCVIGLPTKSKNSICWRTAVEKSLNVVFNYSSAPWSWNIVTSMLNRGAIDAKSLISHSYSLSNYKEMFEEVKKGNVVKGVFLP